MLNVLLSFPARDTEHGFDSNHAKARDLTLPLNALTDQAYVLHPFESTQKRFSFSEGEG